MSLWSLVPMIAGMASSYMGSQQVAASTIEGAQSQANMEKMSREYATKTFEEDIERQKPFYDAGVKAGVKYNDAITNKLDPTKSGAYKMQMGLISPDLKDAPEYVREGAFEKLGAIEGEKQKSRLLDLQQIGLGAAGSSGQSSLNLGTMLAQSYGLSGNVTAGANQSASEQKQSMWNTAASQLSGLPAYFAAGRSDKETI